MGCFEINLNYWPHIIKRNKTFWSNFGPLNKNNGKSRWYLDRAKMLDPIDSFFSPSLAERNAGKNVAFLESQATVHLGIIGLETLRKIFKKRKTNKFLIRIFFQWNMIFSFYSSIEWQLKRILICKILQHFHEIMKSYIQLNKFLIFFSIVLVSSFTVDDMTSDHLQYD